MASCNKFSKEFGLHSIFGSVVLVVVVVVVERLAVSENFGVSLSESWDSNPLKNSYLMIFIVHVDKLVVSKWWLQLNTVAISLG